MTDALSELEVKDLKNELKRLRLQSALRKNLASEMERQKSIAIEAQGLATAKTNELDKMVKRLKLESQLRKNLSSEMERQKEIAVESQELAVQRKNEIEGISNQLSKYLSPQLYQSIFSGEQQVDIASQRKKLTVFFSDLVGFTSISDSLESEEITAMLNFYLTEMAEIALNFGGTIDKYIGDAILIFFGDPESLGIKEDAIRCVKMAIVMQNRMNELKDQWAQKFGLREPLQMRIGINTGYCTVGNFGSEDRLDYTVIGGQVNLASRLESIAEPNSIMISFDTYSQVADEIGCIEISKVQVKGIKEEIRAFQVCLDINQKTNLLSIETEHLQCNLDIDRLSIDEINQLTKFVEEARKKIDHNSNKGSTHKK